MNFLNEENINLLESLEIPNTYWNNKTLEYKYWFRSLLQKIDSALIFKGLPKGWNEDFFHLCLWVRGFVSVFETNRKDLLKYGEDGIVFQPCHLSGYDFYYQPTTCNISNPFYTKNLIIGKECEILKLTPDYRSVLDIIDFYASLLSECTKSIQMGLVNAKVPLILSANTQGQAETLKKVYDKVQAGETIIIWKNTDLDDSDGEVIPSKEPFEAWTQDFKDSYIVTPLLENMNTLLNSFYNEIGIPVSVEKKERLITSETEFSNAQSQARIACWVETLNECLKVINERYNLNIEVEHASTNNLDRNGERTE